VARIQGSRSAQGAGDHCGEFLGHPANALQLVAVTGTNGKTTITSVMDCDREGLRCQDRLVRNDRLSHTARGLSSANTTPESVDLQGFFAEIRDAGGTYAVLEASSHSL